MDTDAILYESSHTDTGNKIYFLLNIISEKY